MHLTHNILVGLLALIFLLAGVSKVSGNPKGLSGTRELNLRDFFARAIGLVEVFASLALLYGLRYPDSFVGWGALVLLWCDMGFILYLHSKAEKLRSAYPSFLLLTLISVVLVIA
jgi:uncharacterized membrane protein YphA (DoxX/SURF4 family)